MPLIYKCRHVWSQMSSKLSGEVHSWKGRTPTSWCGQYKGNEIRTTTEEHGHEKITGCRKVVEEKVKRNPHMAREICLAEIMWFNFGLTYTYCNADFVHVSTLPLENRASVNNKNCKLSPELSGKSVNDIPPVKGISLFSLLSIIIQYSAQHFLYQIFALHVSHS